MGWGSGGWGQKFGLGYMPVDVVLIRGTQNHYPDWKKRQNDQWCMCVWGGRGSVSVCHTKCQ